MSKFKLVLGMQVVERLVAYQKTNKEFRVSTYYGENRGWIEVFCQPHELDSIKELELYNSKEGQFNE